MAPQLCALHASQQQVNLQAFAMWLLHSARLNITAQCRSHAQSKHSSLQDAVSMSGTAALAPSQALQAHIGQLTAFEQSEILHYQEVYFCGLQMAHKHEATPQVSDLNHGCGDILLL